MKFTFPPESRPLDGYTLKRGIARGGFGEVYYGLSDAGKEVAIKLLQQNMDVELRGVQHCLNLRHPHLVAIYDVKTDADKDHWVIMEYIGGDTLEQVLLKRPGPLPLDQITCWMRGVESGLAYLHDRGIVHRDVKPGNIFWDDGAIKIGDVGLSKFMTPSRRSAHTESVGTVYYMAPEVTYGKYGYEVDIYSCGVMLYEMLTGRLPFDGQSTGEILMKHLSEAPDLSVVPPQYRNVVAGALEKDPKKRTPTITRMFQEYESARNGHPIPVPPSGSHFAVLPTAPVVSFKAVIPANPGIAGTGIPPFPSPVSTEIPNAPQSATATPENTVAHSAPSFEWWFHRIAAFIALTLITQSFMPNDHSEAMTVLALVIAWPILFTCIRLEPVAGSGLSWLWRKLAPHEQIPVYSGRWWANRFLGLTLIALTLMGIECGFFRMQSESLFVTFLATVYLSFYVLRPAKLELEGVALDSTTVKRLSSRDLRDWIFWLTYQSKSWDQTRIGFWVQRIALYFWPQIMLMCVQSTMGGARSAIDNALGVTFFFFPFMMGSWAWNRPDMRPRVVPDRMLGKDTATADATVPPPVVSDVNPVSADARLTETVIHPPASPKRTFARAGLTHTPQTVRHVSGRQRLVDLTASMCWATILTVLFAVGTGYLSPLFGEPSNWRPDSAKLGLFTITTLIAAWTLLAAGKLTEGLSQSGKPRRLLNLGLGLCIGAMAWWLGQFLMVELSASQLRNQSAFVTLGRQPLIVNNSPTLLSFLLFFGLLFALRRWWWHADAYRPAVFRVSSVILTVAVAAVLPMVFAFPWDWAVTWAAVISCVVQLSAVWIPPERRTA